MDIVRLQLIRNRPALGPEMLRNVAVGNVTNHWSFGPLRAVTLVFASEQKITRFGLCVARVLRPSQEAG